MSLDLRKTPCDDAVARVAYAFAVQFDATTEVRKRRSIGCRTDRDTWVRIEARAIEKIDGQGFNGPEAAAIIEGVAKPAWYQGMSWLDQERGVMWRADETELVTMSAVKLTGILADDPRLSDTWWHTLTSSLSVLARYRTTRIATPSMQQITQERVTAAIQAVFPDIDTTVDEWTTAHGDFAWGNVTAPACVILDWEDWGRAPRGFDAAMLWLYSLAVPALADRVQEAFRTDLNSRSGLLSQLMHCAEVMTWPGYEQLGDPAKVHAERIIGQLTKSA
jgi:hypothetical protein